MCPLLQYRDMGYLPEAMFNFLAILGWSLDDHTEILTREDLIQNFSLERITKRGQSSTWTSSPG